MLLGDLASFPGSLIRQRRGVDAYAINYKREPGYEASGDLARSMSELDLWLQYTYFQLTTSQQCTEPCCKLTIAFPPIFMQQILTSIIIRTFGISLKYIHNNIVIISPDHMLGVITGLFDSKQIWIKSIAWPLLTCTADMVTTCAEKLTSLMVASSTLWVHLSWYDLWNNEAMK